MAVQEPEKVTRDEGNEKEEDEKEDEEEEEEEKKEEEEEEDEQELAVNLKVMRDGFTPGAEGEVPLASYFKAYHEVNKFMMCMGPLFTFVTYEVENKMAVVQKKMAGENGHHYVNLKTMMDYETELGIVTNGTVGDPLSGTNAFLNLHRGLEFARGFLEKAVKEEEEDGPTLGQAASELYRSTLARFNHSSMVDVVSSVLMLMPAHTSLMNMMTKGNEEAEEKVLRLIPEVITSMKETYEACQTLYRGLHEKIQWPPL